MSTEAPEAAAPTPDETEVSPSKKPYEPPRIEKRRSVARVTLLSGTAQMGVGVVGRQGT